MKAVLKIAGLFLLTVLFLSITVKDKTMFGHLYHVISPGTQEAQKLTESLFKSTIDASKSYTKKLFDNSVPKVKDAVRVKLAAPNRAPGMPQETILHKEKEELDELIKSQN